MIASIASLVALLALAGPAAAHHGHRHHSFDRHDAAGKIASFDPSSGKLTIALFGGDSVSGVVTGETRIEYAHSCPHGWSLDSRARHGHGRHSHRADWGHGDWSHSWDDHGLSTAALQEGTVVDEADLELQDGIASFEKIELVK
jgi:hypothetical protein